MSLTRRVFLLGVGAAAGAVGARAYGPNLPVLEGAGVIVPETGAQVLNDASQLSQTPIFRHIVLKDDPGETLLATLRAEMKAAAAEGRAINIGAARHSMGGQSIPRDGHAVSFDNGLVEPGDKVFRAHAGARWRDVIRVLDPVALSPAVMQSNHDFGVASTFSVNAHGWPTAFGPMGSTVRAVKMLLADGSHVTASRTENADLFSAAMGGYGLIGLITELEVDAEANMLLQPTFEEMPADAFAAVFSGRVKEVPMAYGRLNVDRAGFFQDAMLVSYRPVSGDIPEAAESGMMSKISRHIFRAQLGNEWVKHRRWGIETGVGASLAGATSRSSLMNEPVVTLDDRDANRTDILHEYFVAPDRFAEFLQAARAIIPSSYQELLNITLRWVEQDSTSVLSYAPKGPRIASVLLYSQEMTARAEADMAWMTGRMIEAVQAIGGSYYLPYRPHASLAQFQAGYARSEEFVALKRRVDPGLLFRNALWDKYMAGI